MWHNHTLLRSTISPLGRTSTTPTFYIQLWPVLFEKQLRTPDTFLKRFLKTVFY